MLHEAHAAAEVHLAQAYAALLGLSEERGAARTELLEPRLNDPV